MPLRAQRLHIGLRLLDGPHFLDLTDARQRLALRVAQRDVDRHHVGSGRARHEIMRGIGAGECRIPSEEETENG
ncbi:hypothetical protein D3C71_2121450 [compost metagenome]